MIFYTAFTLVDITQTGITRNRKGEEKQRHQQRNWETVLQVIGLRAQPQMIEGPYDSEYELTDGGIFGEMFRGKHMVWHFSFALTSQTHGKTPTKIQQVYWTKTLQKCQSYKDLTKQQSSCCPYSILMAQSKTYTLLTNV